MTDRFCILMCLTVYFLGILSSNSNKTQLGVFKSNCVGGRKFACKLKTIRIIMHHPGGGAKKKSGLEPWSVPMLGPDYLVI